MNVETSLIKYDSNSFGSFFYNNIEIDFSISLKFLAKDKAFFSGCFVIEGKKSTMSNLRTFVGNFCQTIDNCMDVF